MFDFHICYEQKQRELDNVCLLKAELERRGYSVKIIDKGTLWREKSFFHLIRAPRVLIVPNFYNDENIKNYMKNYKSKTMTVVNLHSEQVLSQKWIENGFHFPKGEAKNAFHICWSKLTQDRLKANIEENKLLVLGNISTDFNRPQFSSFFLNRMKIALEFNLDTQKKWILFISSFTLATYSDRELKKLIEDTSNDVSDLQICMIESKSKIMQWVVEFIEQHPNNEFIYRPHPSENKDPALIKLTQTNENFHVIQKYSVRQWIKVCDNINTWISTSIIDSYFMNKYCSILRPISIPKNIDSEILIGAEYITNYKDFVDINTNKIMNSFPISKEMIVKYYKNDTKTSVYKKICDELENLLKNTCASHQYSMVQGSMDAIHFSKKLKNSIVIIIKNLSLRKLMPSLKWIKNSGFRSLISEYYGLRSDINQSCNKLKKLL